MTIKTLKEQLDIFEVSEDTHVVIADLSSGQRVEIVNLWCDSHGVLNIIADADDDAGPIDERLRPEVFGGVGADALTN